MVAAGFAHTVLLRSDGSAVAFGCNNVSGQCNIPASGGETSYTQAAAGLVHSVMLKSDGSAVAFGTNANGQRTSLPQMVRQATLNQLQGIVIPFC